MWEPEVSFQFSSHIEKCQSILIVRTGMKAVNWMRTITGYDQCWAGTQWRFRTTGFSSDQQKTNWNRIWFFGSGLELELDFYFLKNWIQNKILWLHLRVELELELKPRIWKKKDKNRKEVNL